MLVCLSIISQVMVKIEMTRFGDRGAAAKGRTEIKFN